MTLLELLEAEDVTLHDAVLLSHLVDYAQRTLKFELDLWIGGTSQLEEEREAHHKATLVITGVRYVAQEASGDPTLFDRPSTVDGFVTRAEDVEISKLPDVPDHAFRHSLFIFDGNCFIHFAGTGAELVRHGLKTDRASAY